MVPPMPNDRPSVSFAIFCELVGSIGRIKPRTVQQGAADSSRVYEHLRAWISTYRAEPRKAGTAALFFRCFFPETDVRRRFGMQETMLSSELIKAWDVGWNTVAAAEIKAWDRRSGCLGLELQHYLESRRINVHNEPTLTLHDVDALLDELATNSPFSNLEAHRITPLAPDFQPREPRTIIKLLFRDLTPYQSAVMAQIILKDLSPLLYPLPTRSTHLSLVKYNSTAFYRVEPAEVMQQWHWALRHLALVRDLDVAALLIEEVGLPRTPAAVAAAAVHCHPAAGQLVQIPKAEKSHRGVPGVIAYYMKAGVEELCVETKYDGERMQIHVNTLLPKHEQIKIFSKSKRDSTEDRHATHPVIRCALGLYPDRFSSDIRLLDRAAAAPPSKHAVRTIIIEAEMVAYNERTGQIDEFWRISNLKHGVDTHSSQGAGTEESTQTTHESQMRRTEKAQVEPGPDKRHYMLVFFDVLELNGTSFLRQPLSRRRLVLQEVVRPIEGWSKCAQQTIVSLHGARTANAHLGAIFRDAVKNCEEGLFVKPLQSQYNGFRPKDRWTKLKRDYIPGEGDTCSFVILAASHEKGRGRQLGVSVLTYTTFYVGLLRNKQELLRDPGATAKYTILFGTSYGLGRKQLDDLNYYIGGMVTCAKKDFLPKVYGYTYTLSSSLESQPTHFFAQPMVFDIFGAGWTKSFGSSLYALRHPRVANVYRHSRPLSEAVDLKECQEIAERSVSRMDKRPIHDGSADASALWDSFAISGEPAKATRPAAEHSEAPAPKRHKPDPLSTTQAMRKDANRFLDRIQRPKVPPPSVVISAPTLDGPAAKGRLPTPGEERTLIVEPLRAPPPPSRKRARSAQFNAQRLPTPEPSSDFPMEPATLPREEIGPIDAQSKPLAMPVSPNRSPHAVSTPPTSHRPRPLVIRPVPCSQPCLTRDIPKDRKFWCIVSARTEDAPVCDEVFQHAYAKTRLSSPEGVLLAAGWRAHDGTIPRLATDVKRRGVIYLDCEPQDEVAAVNQLNKSVKRSLWNPVVDGRPAGRGVQVYRLSELYNQLAGGAVNEEGRLGELR